VTKAEQATGKPNGGAQSQPDLLRARFTDLAPAAQIREVALRLFAANGVSDTSIRMVAAAAGVSAGAVMHHYKTKNALEQAVQEHVVGKIRDSIHGVGTGEDLMSALVSRRQAFDELLAAEPYLGEYLRRLLLTGDSGGADMFRIQIGLVREEMGTLVDAGLARQMDDPEVGIVLYWLLVSSRVLIRPLLESTLGLDLSKRADMTRLDKAEIDLLTRPLFPLPPER
jgi:AcrR family transcriptional regulator